MTEKRDNRQTNGGESNRPSGRKENSKRTPINWGKHLMAAAKALPTIASTIGALILIGVITVGVWEGGSAIAYALTEANAVGTPLGIATHVSRLILYLIVIRMAADAASLIVRIANAIANS